MVFLNTFVLSTEHYRQPDWLDDFQGKFWVSDFYFRVCLIFVLFPLDNKPPIVFDILLVIYKEQLENYKTNVRL